MTIEELYEHYKNARNIINEFGIKPSHIYNWVHRGRIPQVMQRVIEKKTDGALKADHPERFKRKTGYKYKRPPEEVPYSAQVEIDGIMRNVIGLIWTSNERLKIVYEIDHKKLVTYDYSKLLIHIKGESTNEAQS